MLIVGDCQTVATAVHQIEVEATALEGRGVEHDIVVQAKGEVQIREGRPQCLITIRVSLVDSQPAADAI